jgi:hypothetical protein
MSTLEDWTAAVVAELGVADLVDAGTRDLVLDMTRDVAHGVARPAAPLTAYLMGLAVGRGADPATLAARIATLATTWTPGSAPPAAAAPAATGSGGGAPTTARSGDEGAGAAGEPALGG